jgi:hypothetical protein
MHNYVLTEKKIKKKRYAGNTALPPTRRKSQRTKAQSGGYAAVQPFSETKKKQPFFG